jgi:hypothetical protein
MINLFKHETSYVDRHITEVKAPTDESVKLLAEFEEAARKKIIHTTVVDTNTFKCKIHTAYDVFNGEYIYRFIIDLNGVKKDGTVRIRTWDQKEPEGSLVQVRDAIALLIANEMIKEAMLIGIQKA